MKLMSVEIKNHTPPSKFTVELEFNSYEDYFIFEAVTGSFKPLVPELECFSASESIRTMATALRLDLAQSLLNNNTSPIIRKLKELSCT